MTNTAKPKLIYSADKNPKQVMHIYEWNGRKFKIRFEHTNGSSCGFNSKCSVSIMNSDGEWKYLEDNNSLGIDWRNMYYKNDEYPRIAEVNKTAEKVFINYIKTVY
jgi:hypothetical protein